MTSDPVEATSVRESSRKSSICLKPNQCSTNSPLKYVTSFQDKAQSEISSRLKIFTIDLTGDSDEEIVNELPTGNANLTTSLIELQTQKTPKTKQIVSRKSSRAKNFDISKKEYLCKLMNVSGDDDGTAERQLKSGIYDSPLQPETPVMDKVDNSKVIDLVSSGRFSTVKVPVY